MAEQLRDAEHPRLDVRLGRKRRALASAVPVETGSPRDAAAIADLAASATTPSSFGWVMAFDVGSVLLHGPAGLQRLFGLRICGFA